ncbi:MAG: hypothetical protein AUK47_06100 [Deltaproteobacteria bacterium CG2_30_63_29]|nr:MAG: hypothetical protein AUK47_06100 [Deltaproteobacteria bacterium CG2_30_63_29]PJB48464.1 MAG: hypothetical protein CO108_02310 [Deltaproteobacteria bacterium CG_4_9_14_3_um_filter_63_12]
MSDTYEQKVEKLARKIRGVGYIFFLAAIFWVIGSLLGSIIPAVSENRARDPFTNDWVDDWHTECQNWAEQLRVEEPLDTSWTLRTVAWTRECGHLDQSDAATLAERMKVRDSAEK